MTIEQITKRAEIEAKKWAAATRIREILDTLAKEMGDLYDEDEVIEAVTTE